MKNAKKRIVAILVAAVLVVGTIAPVTLAGYIEYPGEGEGSVVDYAGYDYGYVPESYIPDEKEEPQYEDYYCEDYYIYDETTNYGYENYEDYDYYYGTVYKPTQPVAFAAQYFAPAPATTALPVVVGDFTCRRAQ